MVERITVQLVFHEPLQLLVQLEHELGAWRDLVRVEKLRHFFALGEELVPQLLGVFGASETTRSLLVHLGARCHTVDRQKDELAWLDYVNNLVNGSHDVRPDVLKVSQLRNTLVPLRVVPVDRVVNNTVQIQVKVVCIESEFEKEKLESSGMALICLKMSGTYRWVDNLPPAGRPAKSLGSGE